MDDLLQRLTGEQALEVVRRLAGRKGAVAEATAETARDVLAAVDVEQVADEVFCALDSIDVQDCGDRAGPSRHGYTDPVEAATELVEEELQSFSDQADRYHELGMDGQERDYCMGIALGAYRYVQESDSEFKDWCEDIPANCVGYLLDRWRKRVVAPSSHAAMDAFVQEYCPAWARYLVRPRDRLTG